MNNSKLVIFLSGLFAVTLTAPLATAGAHSGGGHSFAGHPGMGMPGRPGMGMPGRPGMGMPNSASGFHRFSDSHLVQGDRFHQFHHDHFHHDHFHHEHEDEIIFIGDFGFPWWWGWGWGPWWGWGWGYPYGYDGGYPYGYDGGYGSGYGYGDSSRSRVAELQRRLAHAGYYHGAIDGILGPRTRRAIRAYERDHGGSAYGAIDQRLPFENQDKSQSI